MGQSSDKNSRKAELSGKNSGREETKEELRNRKKMERVLQVKRTKRRLLLGVLVISGFLVGAILFFSNRGSREVWEPEKIMDTEEAQEGAKDRIQAENLQKREEYLGKIRELASENVSYQTVLDNQEEYPDGVLRLCAQNGEALNFVLDYPEKKDQPAESTVGEVTKGQVPLLIQWDRRWGYAPYGEGGIVAVSGCGPTCIAMVASCLTGRNDITPAVVAKYSAENGFLTATRDTDWDLMTYGAEEYGITGTVLGLDENAMANYLTWGNPIIASVGPGDFTSAGHFIVLTGYDGEAFSVNDPNSIQKSQKKWTFEQLKGQIRNLWYYELM